MTEAITELIDLQRQINDVEIEFDLRRALLDHKQENILKEAYERRTKIIMGINKHEMRNECYGELSVSSHDENYAGNDPCLNNRAYEFGTNNSNAAQQTSWSRISMIARRHSRDDRQHEKAALKGFWCTVLMNSRQLSCLIQEHDREALHHLVNVSSTTNTTKLKSEKTFTFKIGFHFAPNPFFHNDVLIKEYFVNITTEKGNTLQYYGPRIYKSIGCTVNWKPGMDLTKRSPPKRPPRNSSLPNVPSIASTVSAPTHITSANCKEYLKIKEWIICGGKDSFFNYFSFPEIPEDIILDETDEALLDKDFQIGWHIKDDIIPQALFYFFGDVSDSESDDASEGSSSDSDRNENCSRISGNSSESPERCQCGRSNMKRGRK